MFKIGKAIHIPESTAIAATAGIMAVLAAAAAIVPAALASPNADGEPICYVVARAENPDEACGTVSVSSFAGASLFAFADAGDASEAASRVVASGGNASVDGLLHATAKSSPGHNGPASKGGSHAAAYADGKDPFTLAHEAIADRGQDAREGQGRETGGEPAEGEPRGHAETLAVTPGETHAAASAEHIDATAADEAEDPDNDEAQPATGPGSPEGDGGPAASPGENGASMESGNEDDGMTTDQAEQDVPEADSGRDDAGEAGHGRETASQGDSGREDAAAEGTRRARIAIVGPGASSSPAISDCIDLTGCGARSDSTDAQDVLREVQGAYPDADIVSIRILDDDGAGTIAGAYAGVECAIALDATSIVATFPLPDDAEGGIMAAALSDAHAAGIDIRQAESTQREQAAEEAPGEDGESADASGSEGAAPAGEPIERDAPAGPAPKPSEGISAATPEPTAKSRAAKKAVKAAPAKAAGQTVSATKTELRTNLGWGGHAVDRTGSKVPRSEVVIDNGGQLPLARASVRYSGFQKNPVAAVKTCYYGDEYGIWLPFRASYVCDKEVSVPGTITLKWSNIAADSQGDRLDLVLKVSNITVKTNDDSCKRCGHVMLLSNFNKTGASGELCATAYMDKIASARIGAAFTIEGSFYKTGTTKASNSPFVFAFTDIDQPDKTTSATKATLRARYAKNRAYVESIQLLQGFAKDVYLQSGIPQRESGPAGTWTNPICAGPSGLAQQSWGPSTLSVDAASGLFRATYESAKTDVYHRYMRTAFACVSKTGAGFKFRWHGSHCGTKIVSAYDGVVLRDRNDGKRTTGGNRTDRAIIVKTVNNAGVRVSDVERPYDAAVPSRQGGKRTATSWRSTSLPWKGTTTYRFSAPPGYRVSNVSVKARAGNATLASYNYSKGPQLASISFGAGGTFPTDRDYDIVVTTAAVSPAHAKLEARKALADESGATAKPVSGQFKLGIYRTKATSGQKPIATVDVDAGGRFAHTLDYVYSDAVSYPRTETYWMHETPARGARCDDSWYRADIVVTRSGNALAAAVTYADSSGKALSGPPTFRNTLTPRGGVRARKVDASTLSGVPGATFAVYRGAFGDAASAIASGKPLATAVSDATGTAQVPDSALPANGGSYTVVESEAPRGYRMSSPRWFRSFTLSRDGQIADLASRSSDWCADAPDTASFTPRVTKALSGADLAPHAFQFALKRDGKALQTATNDADGNITFDSVAFTSSDVHKTHHFTVEEVPGSDAQMSYDGRWWSIDVSVFIADGTLQTCSRYAVHDKDANATWTAPSPDIAATAVPSASSAPYTLSVNYYAGGATYDAYTGNSIDNQLLYTQTLPYGRVAAKGLGDYTSAGTWTLRRAGFKPTGFWTCTVGGRTYRIHESENNWTAQQLAAWLGMNLSTGNRTANLYAEWVPEADFVLDSFRTSAAVSPNARWYNHAPQTWFSNVYEPRVGVRIGKEGDDGSGPLAGAVFEIAGADGDTPIYDASDKRVSSLTVSSDDAGIAQTPANALVAGRAYRIREISPPNGYGLGDSSWKGFIAGSAERSRVRYLPADEDPPGHAYAIWDAGSSTLRFLRSAEEHASGEVAHVTAVSGEACSGTVYGGFEGLVYDTNAYGTGTPTMNLADSVPWHGIRSSVRHVEFADPICPRQTAWWFAGMSGLEDVRGIENLRMCRTTSMTGMFEGCKHLAEIDLGGLDTSSIVSMASAFEGCTSLRQANLAGFCTTRLADMSRAFEGCAALRELDVSAFDTSSLKTAESAFVGCTGLESVLVSAHATWPADTGARTQAIQYRNGQVNAVGTWTDAPLSCTATIAVHKEYACRLGDGQAIPLPVKPGSFAFELREAGDIGKTVATTRICTGGTGEGEARFPAIRYTAADIGEHVYEVVEVPGDDANIEYDRTPRTVRVHVAATERTADDGTVSRKLDAVVDDSQLTPFSNVCRPSFDLSVRKQAQDGTPLPGAEFAVFEIAPLGSGDTPALPETFRTIDAFESAFPIDAAGTRYRYSPETLADAGNATFVGTITSREDGAAVTEKGALESGKAYAIVETSAPPGYLLDDRRSPAGGSARIYLVDDYAPGGGYAHMVKPATGDAQEAPEAIHLDAAGSPAAVPEGFPDGYATSGYTCEIESGTITPNSPFTYRNTRDGTPRGGLKVRKVDVGDAGRGVSGAEFAVFDDESFTAAWRAYREESGSDADDAHFLERALADSDTGESERGQVGQDSRIDAGRMDIGRLASGDDGWAQTAQTALPPGTYRVVEIDAPDGYDLAPYDFGETPDGGIAIGGSARVTVTPDAISQADAAIANRKSPPRIAYASIDAHKTLARGRLAGNDFRFELFADADAGSPLASAMNEADGNVHIATIGYCDNGTWMLYDADFDPQTADEDSRSQHEVASWQNAGESPSASFILREHVPEAAHAEDDQGESWTFEDFVNARGRDAASAFMWTDGASGISYDAHQGMVNVEMPDREEFSLDVAYGGDGANEFENEAPAVEGGGCRVKKASEAGDPLEGATFTVYALDEASHETSAIATIVTDAEGLASTAYDALPPGSYIVSETRAPTGYRLNTQWNRAFRIEHENQFHDFAADEADWCIDATEIPLPVTGHDGILFAEVACVGAVAAGIAFILQRKPRPCREAPAWGKLPRIRRSRIARMMADVFCGMLVLSGLAIGAMGYPTPIAEAASIAPLKDAYPTYETNPAFFDARDWESVAHQADRTRANDDGSLSQWVPGWYVAHGDTGYGKAIAKLKRGDDLRIDGLRYVIDDKALIEQTTKARDVVAMAHSPDIIIETCSGMKQPDGTALVWIAWGHAAPNTGRT